MRLIVLPARAAALQLHAPDGQRPFERIGRAGVLPLRLEAQSPVPDPRLPAGIPVPASLSDYRGNT
jgi:hypothetical protein